MSCAPQSTFSALHGPVIGVSYGTLAEECVLKHDDTVSLLINMDETTARVGTATLYRSGDDAASTLKR